VSADPVGAVRSHRGGTYPADVSQLDQILELWDTTYNIKYTQLQEVSLSESLTQHRKDERGRYGRRSSSAVKVQDVFVYPHLYGSLVQHKGGLNKVLSHPHLNALIDVVKSGQEESSKDILTLKSAVWALCHVGSSHGGLCHLLATDALQAVIELAEKSTVYTIRGTCFMALSIIASTYSGAMALRTFGWESVYRSHHQKWQSSVCPVYDTCRYQQHYLPAPSQHCGSKANPYYTQPSEDNYIGHTPKNAFYLSPDTDDDTASNVNSEDDVDEDANSPFFQEMPVNGKKSQVGKTKLICLQ